jgi:hypothetical protein
MIFSNLKRPLFKTIFISHHVICSLISSCSCNHLNSMLMNVKLMVTQLKLNGIGYKLVFHSSLKFASNTSYTLICKFEEHESKPKWITWVWRHIIYWIYKLKKNWKILWKKFFHKKRKQKRKQTSSFGNLKIRKSKIRGIF